MFREKSTRLSGWDRQTGQVRMGFATFNPPLEGIKLKSRTGKLKKLRGKSRGEILWRESEQAVILTYSPISTLWCGPVSSLLTPGHTKSDTSWPPRGFAQITWRFGGMVWSLDTREKHGAASGETLACMENLGKRALQQQRNTRQTRLPSKGLALFIYFF